MDTFASDSGTISCRKKPEWRNWQTRWTQNPMSLKDVPVRARLWAQTNKVGKLPTLFVCTQFSSPLHPRRGTFSAFGRPAKVGLSLRSLRASSQPLAFSCAQSFNPTFYISCENPYAFHTAASEKALPCENGTLFHTVLNSIS